MGVTVFFVLSGYLITSLLLIEWDNTETINLPQFWLRRVRRLMPAIVLIIVCTAALCALFDHSLLTKLRERHVGRAALGDELVVHPPRCFLFRRARRSLAAHPLLVARHRRSSSTSSGRSCCWSPTKAGVKRTTMRNATLIVALLVGAGDGAAVQPAGRPEPRVLRHRHPRVLAAYRRMAGVRVALAHAGSPEERAPSRSRCATSWTAWESSRSSPCCGLIVFVDGFSPFLYRGGILLGLRPHRRRHRA